MFFLIAPETSAKNHSNHPLVLKSLFAPQNNFGFRLPYPASSPSQNAIVFRAAVAFAGIKVWTASHIKACFITRAYRKLIDKSRICTKTTRL